MTQQSPFESEADEPPDLRGPAVVVQGGVIGGFTFYGPFETIDAAHRWYAGTIQARVGAQASIVLLEKPK